MASYSFEVIGGEDCVRCSDCRAWCRVEHVNNTKHALRHNRRCDNAAVPVPGAKIKAPKAAAVREPRNLEEAETQEDGEPI